MQEEQDKLKAKNQELESNYMLLKTQYTKQKKENELLRKDLKTCNETITKYEELLRMQDQNIRTLQAALEDKKKEGI